MGSATSSTRASRARDAYDVSPPRLRGALALLSAGGLLLEISLTRLLSVLWFDSFVYVLLAVAVLGLGLGAALATAAPALRHTRRLPAWLALAGGTGALLAPSLIALGATGGRALGYGLVILPYAFMGLAVASIFAAYAEESPQLYLADLGGAGVGGLLAAPLLDALGGVGAILASAVLMAAGAPLAGIGARARAAAVVVPVVVAGFLAAHLAGGGPRVDWARVSTPKPIVERLAEGWRVEDVRWDALARTDLVVSEDGGRIVYLDGGAGSLVPDLDGADAWARDVGAFAFEAIQPESAFLLGSGGGLDIALARRARVDRIVAAEINRGSVAFSMDLEPELYGGVELHVDEGRSVLRRAGTFDLILLAQTVTQNAELRGIALTENALYTVEAVRTYLDHLEPEGAVAFKLYDELTLTRALTTSVAALATHGRSEADAMAHLFAVLDPRASPPVPLLMVRREALARAEAVDWARAAEASGFALLYVPHLLEPPPLDGVAAGRLGLEAVIEASPEADLSPPTDRRPFFWQFERGVPRALWPLVGWLALGLVAGLALHGLALRRMARVERWGLPAVLALGAGFMLAEIALLQRVQLLVGHPTLALGSALGMLLMAAGLGSAISARWPVPPARMAALGALAAAGALAAIELAWPAIHAAFEAQPTTLRLAAALVPVALVALPMGVPFPHLLRRLADAGSTAPRGLSAPARVAAAWTVNGYASVVGAVAALVLAVVLGFPAVVAAGAACYVLAALAAAQAH